VPEPVELQLDLKEPNQSRLADKATIKTKKTVDVRTVESADERPWESLTPPEQNRQNWQAVQSRASLYWQALRVLCAYLWHPQQFLSLMGAFISMGALVMTGGYHTGKEVFYLFVIGLLAAKAIHDHWRHESGKEITAILIMVSVLSFAGLASWTEWQRHSERDPVQSEDRPGPTIEAKPRYFHVSIGPVLALGFPEQFFYSYPLGEPKYLAPVWLLLQVEVANLRPTATRIKSYAFDIGNKQEDRWTRIYMVGMADPEGMYLCPYGNTKVCKKLAFHTNSFDLLAAKTEIPSGGSFRGWMFFEWPPRVRGEGVPEFNAYRIHISNTLGERETIILDRPKTETGERLFGDGQILLPYPERVDMSRYKVQTMHEDVDALTTK